MANTDTHGKDNDAKNTPEPLWMAPEIDRQPMHDTIQANIEHDTIQANIEAEKKIREMPAVDALKIIAKTVKALKDERDRLREANAALQKINADLLAALKNIEAYEYRYQENYSYLQARAAIAKAEASPLRGEGR